MATITTDQITKITALIQYLDTGSAGHTLTQGVTDQIARMFGGTCGFKCGCPGTLSEGLRDSPTSTFLKLLLCVSGVIPGTPAAAAVAAATAVCNPLVSSPFLSTFGVLAGTSITNTGGSVIQGDLGLSAGTSVVGFPPGSVIGVQHITDTAAANAQLALTSAYLIAAGATAGAITVSGNLGGQTLPPGLYNSASSLAISSGDLTLDAQGNPNATWLFQMGSTLTTTAGRSIFLINGAKANNVVWQVGSSATLGTGSVFQGSILALTSITSTTGAQITGRLLARNGAVTLDTNSLIVPPC